jgi:hypothetical protein
MFFVRFWFLLVIVVSLAGCETSSVSQNSFQSDAEKWCMHKNVNQSFCILHAEMDHSQCERKKRVNKGIDYDYCRLHRIELNSLPIRGPVDQVKCEHRSVGLMILGESVCRVYGKIIEDPKDFDKSRLVRCEVYSGYTHREKIVTTSYWSCTKSGGTIIAELEKSG